jgi:ABC-type uncharacterized transport system substrate-binding protein
MNRRTFLAATGGALRVAFLQGLRDLGYAKPGDLPVEQPTKFDLIVNLRTAKALGLTLPLSLLQRAGQMIE